MKLLPTWTQFKRWSLPAKYTFLGFVLGAVSSGLSVYFGVRPNPQITALNEALRSEKPTKLELSDARSSLFVGETGEIVTLSLRNDSNRPALAVKAQLRSPGGPIPVPADGVFRLYTSPTIAAAGNSELELPVARTAEVVEALGIRCLAGFSIKPRVSERTLGLENPVRFRSVMVQVSFSTVFQENVSFEAPLWAIVPGNCG